MATLIISETYLKAKSIINDNADFETIKPIIEMVQDIYLQKKIGTDLYVKIQNDIIGGTLSGNYKLLVDNYILKYLHWMVVAHTTPVMKFRYMNKGIMEKNSDNSQPSATDDLKYITTQWLNYAEQYGDNCLRYIIANNNLFPEYLTNNTFDKDIPEGSAFASPFYFPMRYGVGLSNDTGDFRYREDSNNWWKE